ncbi:hypothetical protein NSPZN2_80025 [Nitrospira defluvii]|uniref:Uncharacterized protein n=1 Tax=Nitrospira defluvii TaxID=330214 RepID=A0ABM8SBS2_9BACT|nr:hypothetical protein NSPZN2_80025 [Nitrospira defluvii]
MEKITTNDHAGGRTGVLTATVGNVAGEGKAVY